jgi:hypothetical protein
MQPIAAVLAVLGLLGLLIGYGMSGPFQFFQSYFFGYIFWLNITLGCLAFTILHNATRSNWARPFIRLFEAGNKMLWIMAPLFLPIILAASMHLLYPWADPALVAQDPILQHRAGPPSYWMTLPFWAGRAVFFFALWFLWAIVLNRASRRFDETGDISLIQKRMSWGGPGLVMLFLSVTFAYTDWVMSLDAHWYSTIYGVMFVIGQGLGAISLITILVTLNIQSEAYRDVVDKEATRNLGNMMLTLTMFWAYIGLSQFLIQWSGNLPDEVPYYTHRFVGGLDILGGFIVVGQFFLPFVALLSGRTKRTPKLLLGVAAWIFMVRVLDIFWIIVPMWRFNGIQVHWMDVASFVGFGGLWLAGFVWFLKQNRLFPALQPQLEEAVEHA